MLIRRNCRCANHQVADSDVHCTGAYGARYGVALDKRNWSMWFDDPYQSSTPMLGERPARARHGAMFTLKILELEGRAVP